MKHFSSLKENIAQLSLQSAQLDRQRGEHHQALFDERLFHCKARLLVPCVQELESTFQSILREQENGRLTPLRAEHLTTKMLAQLEAIQRELSTQTIRESEIKHSRPFQKPINQLYQEMAQHQEWERRLEELVVEKARALESVPEHMQTQAQQTLMAAEQRLNRCQESKLKIENQITYRERNPV
ncbi:prepilin peptidase [Vibrio sp. S9_S30]|uniref:primosomal replication protein n=1 Tax=Vibrio sp. S9_S30 TaxID=2720226 RepID=UPI0016805697|nr:primosomal replication protein [Vibrio sp. S9_S30]MBD1557902.1 prepilin peptidase [Vibrio sp. S9_S30]